MTKKFVLFAALPLLFSILLVSCADNSSNKTSDSAGTSPVAYVNDETVTENELNYFKDRLRANVMNQYIGEYSCAYSDDFWATTFDGKTPQETLDKQAFEECVKAKLQLVLCRDYGIYDDISYGTFYDEAVAYNEAHSGKQSAAGVESISLTSFYTYYLNNGVLELKNRMAEDKLKPTDDEIARQLDTMSDTVKRALSGDELKNAAAELAVEKKYDDYIASLQKRARIVLL